MGDWVREICCQLMIRRRAHSKLSAGDSRLDIATGNNRPIARGLGDGLLQALLVELGREGQNGADHTNSPA